MIFCYVLHIRALLARLIPHLDIVHKHCHCNSRYTPIAEPSYLNEDLPTCCLMRQDTSQSACTSKLLTLSLVDKKTKCGEACHLVRHVADKPTERPWYSKNCRQPRFAQHSHPSEPTNNGKFVEGTDIWVRSLTGYSRTYSTSGKSSETGQNLI